MTELSIANNSLNVELDDHHNRITIIHRFLQRTYFTLRDDVWINSRVDAELITRTRNFIQKRGSNVNLDTNCLTIIQNQQDAEQRFLNLRNAAEQIKNTPDDSFGGLPIHEFGINPRTNEKLQLRQFQQKSVRHGLALINSANFSVPGAGKTWMAYATYFLAKERQESPNVNRLLVVCPKNAQQVWESEYATITHDNPEEFTPQNNTIRITDEHLESGIIPQLPQEYEIILINYDKIARNQRYEAALQLMLENHDFFVILDESHKIKNYDANTGERLRNLGAMAQRRMILTGTPMPNFHKDLWNQFQFLFPNENILGLYDNFERSVRDNEAEQRRVEQNLFPFFTRVTDGQLGLPGIETPIFDCPMDPFQQEIYDTIGERIAVNEGTRRQRNAYEQWNKNITYLIMAATDPGLFAHDHHYQIGKELIDLAGVEIEERIRNYVDGEPLPGKLRQLRHHLASDVDFENEKIIIWCNYRGTLTKVQEMITQEFDVESRMVSGNPEAGNQEDKERSLREFRGEDGHTEVNILIANPASLSESVSLHQVCHHAIYVDRTYNATHWIQSKKRIHRVGMDDVETKYLILKSSFANSRDLTIDDRIRTRLRRKENSMMRFLDDPGLNNNEMEVRWIDGEPDTDIDLEEYQGIVAGITERLTNNQ